MTAILLLIGKVIAILLGCLGVVVIVAAIAACRDKVAKTLIVLSAFGWFILGFLCGIM